MVIESGELSQNSARLTACRAGDIVVVGEKGGFKFLYTYDIADRASLEWRAGEVLQWAHSGSLKLRIERELPLADVRAADATIESRLNRARPAASGC